MSNTQINHSKKNTLISYCDLYGKGRHIRSRKLFKSYKFALMQDEGLTPNQWKHLARYLRYDLYQTEEQLSEAFKEFIRQPKVKEEPATLY